MDRRTQRGISEDRGTRVSLAEVEARVTAIPGVYECGACAVDHPEAGEALVLFIVPDQGASLRRKKSAAELPAHWTLDSIRLVPELPKTSAGKIARSVALGFGQGAPCKQFDEKIDACSVDSSLWSSLRKKDRRACWKY